MPGPTASNPADVTPHRLAAACALVLLAVGVPPASAKEETSTITMRGSKSAYVDVAFRTRFRLLSDAFTAKPAPVVSTKGTYGGIYLTKLDSPETAGGLLLLRGLPAWDDFPLALGSDGWLPAGTYRVHLLADGATTVRVTAEGLARNVTLAPERASRVSASLVRRRTAGTDVPADRTTIPVTVRPTTLTVLGSSHESEGALGNQHICLRTPGAQLPCTVSGAGGGGTFFGTPGSFRMGSAMVFYPGDVPQSGETEAEYSDVVGGVPGPTYAFALTLN